MDWDTENGLEIARKIKETARHSAAWYRRAARIGKIAAVFCLLSSLTVTGYDFWLELNGYAAGNLIAGIVPGSMAAHLYFRFVQRAAFLLENRRIVLLAAFGALVFLSLEVLLFVRVFRNRDLKGLAFFLFADAAVTYFVVCLLLPTVEYMLLSAVAGCVFRILLGVLLMKGHSGEMWQQWLFAADETLWAAEKYGWSERFNPLTLSEEEWNRIHEDYLAYLEKQEELE
ncbi:MAG: hypothetical protein E7576_16300 [Ruminococcaceae bacterium]|nr:hypothetical protein [Oscillospiraceae bacterium]